MALFKFRNVKFWWYRKFYYIPKLRIDKKKTYKRIYKKLSYPECFIDKSIGLKTEVRYAEEKNIT